MRHNGRKPKIVLVLDNNFALIFISFLVGFLVSFFICWNTIIYIYNLFERVNGIV
jgi:hypothetical protein